MAYTKQTWSDLPSKTTPINASRLGHIEQGIYDAAATADNASTAISAMGTAVSKNSTNAVTQNSGDLVESGAVYTAIANAKASCYKPSGDKTCAELVAGLLVQSNLGNVYNITDSGTTTSDFVGGAGKPISVGDNVAIVDVGSSVYKFDLLAGMVDLSNYQTKALSAQVEGQSTVEGALGALSDADKATRQLIDDTVGWIGKNKAEYTLSSLKAINTSGTWSGNKYTINGCEYTVTTGADGETVESINVNTPSATTGTATLFIVDSKTYRAGTYRITGCPGDDSNDLWLGFYANGDYKAPVDKGSGTTYTMASDTVAQFRFRVKSGVTVSNKTLLPMLSDPRLDDTFVPYHPSVDAQKADNTVIAPVEDGTTASQLIKAGQHFMHLGDFCTAKTDIAQGATFTLNTNYTSGDVASALAIKRAITSSDNLDNVTETGIYTIYTKPTNSPEDTEYAMLIVTKGMSSEITQMVVKGSNNRGDIYIRVKTGSPLAWRSWFKVTGTIVS